MSATPISDKERIRILEEKLAQMAARAEKAEELAGQAEGRVAQAEGRAAQAEGRAVQAESRAQQAEQRLRELMAHEMLSNEIDHQTMAVLVAFMDEVKQRFGVCIYEDTEAMLRIITRGLRMHMETEDLTELSRLYAERIRDKALAAEHTAEQPRVKKETQKLTKKIEKKQKEIRPKEKRLAESDKKLASAAETLIAESDAHKAAKDIMAAYQETGARTLLTQNLNTHGRKAVEQLKNAKPAQKAAPGNPMLCPHCFSAMISTEEMECCARSLITTLSDIVGNLKHSYPIYTCRCGHVHLGTDGKQVPVTLSRTLTQDLVIEAAQMMEFGTPLDRISRMLNTKELQIGSSTLAENMLAWMQEAGGNTLVEAIENVAREADSIVADGTPLRILQQEGVSQVLVMQDADGNDKFVDPNDKGTQQKVIDEKGMRFAKQPYLEIITSVPTTDMPFAIYKRMNSRSADSVKEALRGYTATSITTDGLAQYDSITKNISHQSCLVHFLREVLQVVPLKEYEELGQSVTGQKVLEEKLQKLPIDMKLNLCAKALRSIFLIEKRTSRNDSETIEAWRKRLHEVRQKESRRLMDCIDKLLMPEAAGYASQKGKNWQKTKDSPYTKPIIYYLNQRAKLRTFLDNPAVPVDSNAAERVVRAIAVLRTSCHFKQSRVHTDVMCNFFTLFETAYLVGIEKPVVWLKEFGHAYFTHCCDVMLTKRARDGMDLTRGFTFSEEARASFDIKPWLPWNYVKSKSAQ